MTEKERAKYNEIMKKTEAMWKDAQQMRPALNSIMKLDDVEDEQSEFSNFLYYCIYNNTISPRLRSAAKHLRPNALINCAPKPAAAKSYFL